MSMADADGEEDAGVSGGLAAPARLPSAIAPDPFHVEPGAILLSRRFCVIGPHRHRAGGWQVTATDLKRRFGVPPHHRLDLVFLAADEEARDRAFAVIDAMPGDVARVYAVLTTDEGLALVTHPLEPRPGERSREELRQVAHDLAQLLARLHGAGWGRVRWTADDWRIDATGRAQFADWSWLLGVEPADRPEVQDDDVDALQDLFRDGDWPLEASRPVTSAAELLAGLAPPAPAAGPPLLRFDEAPFVGRSTELQRVQLVAEHARDGGPTTLVLAGPSGSGRSRLLLHASERLDADAVVVRCTKPHVGGLLAALADTFEQLESARRREIVGRIDREVGEGSSELCIFDRRFEAWFGSPPPRQRVVREYPRRLTRLVSLLAAVGSTDHPLVLLLDRFDEASGAVRTLVDRLLAEGESHCTAIVRAETAPVGVAASHLVALEPLTVDETEEWLRGTLPGVVHDAAAIATWLHAQGAAWPARLAQALQWAVSEGVVTSAGGWRLARTPRYEPTPIDELDEDTRWIVLLLAVEGGRGGVRALRQLSRWPIDRLRERLTRLRRQGLVRVEGTTLSFVRREVRQQVLDQVVGDRRRNAHRAMARYLSRQPEVSTSALVHQEDRARHDGFDASLAQRHLRAAEEQLYQLNFERARWHFERAAARDPDLHVQRRAQRGRADALLLTGHVPEAIDAYRTALDHAGGPEDVLAIADRASSALVVRAPRETMRLVGDALGRLGLPVPVHPAGVAWQMVRAGLGLGARLGPAAQRSLGRLHRTLVDLLPLHEIYRAPVLWLRGHLVARRTHDEAGLRHSRIQFARGPVGWWAPSWAQRVLGQAIEDAVRGGDPLAEGLAWIGRAESWWPTGQSADVLNALERAVACFDLAEAPLLKARAEAALVVHQLLCEPIRTLEARIEGLRRTARCQQQQDFGPLLEALTTWTRIRTGRAPGRPGPGASIERQPSATVIDVWADAVFALAWIEADEVVLAHEYAERAWRARCRQRVCVGPLDLALVAAVWVGVRRGQPFVGQTRRRMDVLRRRARRHPGLQPFAALVEAHQAASDHDVPAARLAVERVLQVAALQRQRWIELDAHKLLVRLWAIDDPHQAEHQRVRTEQLQAELVERPGPAPRAPLPEPAEPDDEPTLLDSLVDEMLETLRHHLDGRVLVTELHPGVRTTVRREALELLFVSMMLLVHEVSEGPQLHLSTEIRPKGRVSLRIVGGAAPEEPSPLAVAECDNVARQIGAELTIESTDDAFVVEVQLPAGSAAAHRRGLLAIRVDDARIERMLVEQLRALGWDAMVVRGDEEIDEEIVGCFVAPGHAPPGPAAGWTITVVPRSEGWRRRNELPLPFELDELRSLLDSPHLRRGGDE